MPNPKLFPARSGTPNEYEVIASTNWEMAEMSSASRTALGRDCVICHRQSVRQIRWHSRVLRKDLGFGNRPLQHQFAVPHRNPITENGMQTPATHSRGFFILA